MSGQIQVNSTVPRIVVFDSGVGGLSIYEEMRLLLGPAEYIYCSDNAYFPYGIKSDDVVTQRVIDVARALEEKFHPDVYVVACNTASTVALEPLRQSITASVVGVVPAIKPAAASSVSGIIGLLATPATIKRPYTDELINNFAPNTRVVKVGSAKLVGLAEDFLRGLPIDQAAVAAEIKPLFVKDADDKHGTDTVVLGCTHFPLLVDFLIKASPWPVRWLDSGPAVAARVKSLLPALGERGVLAPTGVAVFTRKDNTQRALLSVLERLNLTASQILIVD